MDDWLRNLERPAWFGEAKWASGILLAACLLATLTAGSLALVTSPSTALPALSALVDEVGEVEKVLLTYRAELAQAASVAPADAELPHQLVRTSLAGIDLSSMAPEHARRVLVRRMAGDLYTGSGLNGVDGRGPKGGEPEGVLAGILGFFRQTTHDRLRDVTMALALASLIPLALLWLFCRGAGRFVAPGVAAVGAALPATLALLAAAIGGLTLAGSSRDPILVRAFALVPDLLLPPTQLFGAATVGGLFLIWAGAAVALVYAPGDQTQPQPQPLPLDGTLSPAPLADTSPSPTA
ncbi:MAG: hypothetical protein HYY05_06165 [Chloroflexi bacterium]|nr:hypothetical protein [Chloroflexota bacterium]